MEITKAELANLLHQAAELGAMTVLTQTGLRKLQIGERT